jgi:hypothetical protein
MGAGHLLTRANEFQASVNKARGELLTARFKVISGERLRVRAITCLGFQGLALTNRSQFVLTPQNFSFMSMLLRH